MVITHLPDVIGVLFGWFKARGPWFYLVVPSFARAIYSHASIASGYGRVPLLNWTT